ncbi:AAA+ ATPase domain-containing protein [Cynara cardunculus var. scolymus]|uniref:AAA+ ATPase domain-containing protein n=1 Tax=Cynara cardunculus var. scolymus TaxID=59895 RepID=A0A118K3L2_CYNCS|nr:AAA+ ATPase domain-containing protein [Cynara cardunculus var. scolymus]
MSSLMEVSSSSSCSSPLSLHRLNFAPPRPVSRFSSKPLTRFTSSTTCNASSSSSSSYFGVSLSHELSKSMNNYTLSRKRRGSFYIVSGVFERFTERAIKAVMFSQREAKALGKDMVYTQHLLLGLIAEDRAPGGFLESGITIDAAREAVRSIWDDDGGLGAAAPPSTSATDVSFSNGTKRVFEAAVEYSRTMGYKFIAPEHIAIGLLTVDDGSAGRVLKKLGADMNRLADVAISRLQGELAKDGREPPASRQMSNKTSMRSLEKVKGKSALDQFCVDLTARASNGLIDPVIGRDSEVERIVQILCRRTKNNPILLGQAGVGKTAIAEGLAIRISDAKVPVFLLTKRVMSLDIGDVILFIDEVHTLIGSGTVGRGNKGSGLDIGNLLKPSLGRGELQCIASTTMDEYRLHFDKDQALARRFQPVLIEEPNQEDAVRILMGLQEKYEAHHKCRYTLDAINAAVYLSSRYIPDRYLPDKAIDLIDEAGSRARMEAFRKKKEEQTDVLSKSPNEYWQEIKAVQAMHDVVKSLPSIVGAGEIAAVASLWSGIPIQQLTADDRMLLVGLDERLKERVCGQDEAVDAICRAVKRSRVGLNDPDRPIATMLFCGPTGVGKTELTKALAACYFGSEGSMLRLDMSEYMERHTVSKLIGSPPGYVGYGEGGTLTEAIRKRPFTVVLLDEIEKAHPDIFNILLQIFEDGHLTDSQGRRVSFKNALVVMTSNVGSTAIAKGRHNSIGFMLADDESSASYAGLKSLVMEELKAYFRPELLNRIDEVVVFRSLEKTQMLEILNMMLEEVKKRLVSFGINLEVSMPVMELICEQGFDRSYGARPLRRALTLIIEDPLSESLLSGEFKQGETAIIELDETGNPVVTNKSRQNVYLSDSSTLS